MASTTMERGYDTSFWRSIRWGSGAMAGLITGSILFFVNHGMPWIGSGAINPSIMGLQVAPGAGATPGYFFGTLALHLTAATVYGMLIGAVAHSFRPWMAGFVAGLIGLVLYFIDYALFAALFSVDAPQREWAAILHHIAFGVISAEAYKGMVRRRRPVPLM